MATGLTEAARRLSPAQGSSILIKALRNTADRAVKLALGQGIAEVAERETPAECVRLLSLVFERTRRISG